MNRVQYQVQFDKVGEPTEVLAVRDNVQVKAHSDDQVLIKVRAAPINPSDLLYVKGSYLTKSPTFPTTAGFEGAGDVIEVGKNVSSVKVGAKVHFRTVGSWSQYAVTNAEDLIPLPDGISYEWGCQILVNPVTAHALIDVGQVQPGEWILQTASASALGRIIIRLGKIKGFKTINVVRRKEQINELKALGADEVIVSTSETISDRVKEITGGKGVRNIFDAVGGDLSELLKSLSYFGTVWNYGTLAGVAQVNSSLLWRTLGGVRCLHLEVYMKKSIKRENYFYIY